MTRAFALASLLAAALIAERSAAAEPPESADPGARPPNRTCKAPDRIRLDTGVALVPALGGARFDQPVAMVQAPDARTWTVIERAGRIVRVSPDSGARTVVSDLTDLVYSRAGETGLLGLAYHPDFDVNRTVLLSFTTGSARALRSRIVRARLALDGSLDRSSMTTLIEVEQPGLNHNGGHLAFGPDGFLYVAFGDGQLNGDPPNHAQRLDSWLGKIHRIDVGSGGGYRVPPDNPFAGSAKRPEIWALGFRNPWRFSFDRRTGELWAGDVGQRSREEVDLVVRGGNYGWSAREGTRCYKARRGCRRPELLDPVVEYDHTEGFAVTGGFVYRGRDLPGLSGRYVFADFGSRTLWAIESDPRTGKARRRRLGRARGHVASFAEDADGELYVLEYRQDSGVALRLAPPGGANARIFPTRLSDTGCVEPADPTRAAPGVEPYAINRPSWSDGARAEHWLAIPDGTAMRVRGDGRWELPAGSVVMQRLRMQDRLVETRLMVRHRDGLWAGYGYAWNAEQTDALLVDQGTQRRYGEVVWAFPSRSQCLRCHNTIAGPLLGLRTAQMDRMVDRGAGPVSQIEALAGAGLLDAIPPLGARRPLLRPEAPAASAEHARAWLDANCSSCHRPKGYAPGTIDLRARTPFRQTGLCRQRARIRVPDYEDAWLLSPGAPGRSVILARVRRLYGYGMPPHPASRVDPRGVADLEAWIGGLEGCP